MKYRLVIFDFDGTLADSFPWFIGAVNGVADRYGFKRIDAREIDLLRGYGAREIVRHLGVPWWKLPLIANHMRKLKAGDGQRISLFPGVGTMLRSLADAGVTLAIVSSNSEENVRRILGADNAALIRYWACDASIFGKKKRFKQVLRESGTRPGEALCIGDEIRDAEAARAAEIAFAAVSWGYTKPEALRRLAPAATFSSTDEIVEFLGR